VSGKGNVIMPVPGPPARSERRQPILLSPSRLMASVPFLTARPAARISRVQACSQRSGVFADAIPTVGDVHRSHTRVGIMRRDGSPAQVAAIALGYALIRSVLASRQAKGVALRLLGAGLRNGLYRFLFNAQAVPLFAWAARAFVRLTDRTLYRVPASWSWTMCVAQLGGIGLMVWAAWAVSIPGMTGLGPPISLLRRAHTRREPEAQGPRLGADGEMLARGPFRFTRHPANWGPLIVVLLFPRMTVNRAALAALSAAYLVLGSVHEELRLLAAHGCPYERYQARVPFLVGRIQGSGARGLR
jgi:protein-S-isoprenylcysteine O-methyltransferase Ste14